MSKRVVTESSVTVVIPEKLGLGISGREIGEEKCNKTRTRHTLLHATPFLLAADSGLEKHVEGRVKAYGASPVRE